MPLLATWLATLKQRTPEDQAKEAAEDAYAGR